MKKILTGILIGLMLSAGIIFSGTSNDLDTWWGELQAYSKANSAKAKFQETMRSIEKHLDSLADMNADGDFDGLPASVKAKFIWAWGQLDAARDTIKADSEFMDAINWTP